MSQAFRSALASVASRGRGAKEASHEDTKVGERPQRHGGLMELEETAGKVSPPKRSAN